MIRKIALAAIVAAAAVAIVQANKTPVVAQEAPTPERLIAGAGRIEPLSEEVQVGADLYGRLRSVLVEEGQHVRKGETVAILRQQLFVYRDLFTWLDDPYQAPPALAGIHDAQLKLAFTG